MRKKYIHILGSRCANLVTKWTGQRPCILQSLTSLQIKYTSLVTINENYHRTCNISCNLFGNKFFDYSDVFGASPVGAAPTTSSFLASLALMDWAKTNSNTRRKTFKFLDLVPPIVEAWWWVKLISAIALAWWMAISSSACLIITCFEHILIFRVFQLEL